MKRALRIAHTADVHLHDGPGCERAHDAFVQVIDAVIATRAGLFLIAGDLFDHNRVQRNAVDFVYAQLARVPCPTVIIAGNHDCFEPSSVLRDMDFRQAGRHVHLLANAEGAYIGFPQLHATVWGRCMIDHDLANKPLAGSPGRIGDMWHIGMAHGLYVDYPETGRSSLVTPEEIAASGFDYLALGHVHVYAQMRHGKTLACYPGAPISDHGSCHRASIALVELIPGSGASVRPYLLTESATGQAVR